MSLEDLESRLPGPAKDLRLNLGGLPGTPALTPVQLWGTALASALAARGAEVIRAVDAEARAHLSETERDAARSAAALMAMNNVYYRFAHLCSNGVYQTLPPRLRMQALARHGIEKRDFELFCLAVSAIHGCGACVDSHERALREAGASEDTVHNAIRVAAIVHGVAATLEAESALESTAAAAA